MYWELGFLRVFSCTIVSPYFIVKSLQLRGRRQIAEPRKYCLVRVIVFSLTCVFSIYFVSHRLEFFVKFPTLKAMWDEVVAVDGWPKILPSVHYSLDLANADYNWASVEELDFFESRLSMP